MTLLSDQKTLLAICCNLKLKAEKKYFIIKREVSQEHLKTCLFANFFFKKPEAMIVKEDLDIITILDKTGFSELYIFCLESGRLRKKIIFDRVNVFSIYFCDRFVFVSESKSLKIFDFRTMKQISFWKALSLNESDQNTILSVVRTKKSKNTRIIKIILSRGDRLLNLIDVRIDQV